MIYNGYHFIKVTSSTHHRNSWIRAFCQRPSTYGLKISVLNFQTFRNYLLLRSFGVATYSFLTGLSPFLDETIEETRSNVLRGNCSYAETSFANISKIARKFVSSILNLDPRFEIFLFETFFWQVWIHLYFSKRPSAAQCLEHQWMQNVM